MIMLGWIVFGIGSRAGLIVPTKGDAYISDDRGEDRRLSDDYPRFDAGVFSLDTVVYSLDVFVPLVDLHMASYWLPNANRGSVVMGLRTGAFLRVYLWFHILAGWVLTTLFVVGLTGLVRRGSA